MCKIFIKFIRILFNIFFQTLSEDVFMKHFDVCIGNHFNFDESYNSDRLTWPQLDRVIYQYPSINHDFVPETNQDIGKAYISPECPIKEIIPEQIKMSNIILHKEVKSKLKDVKISEKHKQLLSIMSQYTDLYYPEVENNHDLRLVFSIHCLNHILKTRKIIMDHHETITSYNSVVETRYNGFTRPKILILTPFKNFAYQ